MVFNSEMKKFLSLIRQDKIVKKNDFPIFQRETSLGEQYWCIKNNEMTDGKDGLIWLEWDMNEAYLNFANDVTALIEYGLGIIAFWEEQMKNEYPKTPFDIVLSADTGECCGSCSVTLRFWNVRNGEHCIAPTNEALEAFHQAVLMKTVNY